MRIWLLMLIVIMSTILGGCGGPKTDSQFKVGDIVVHKLSGNEGQVIDIIWDFSGNWNYKVRFVAEQQVLVKSGDSVKQKMFVTEWMMEYELQAKGGHK